MRCHITSRPLQDTDFYTIYDLYDLVLMTDFECNVFEWSESQVNGSRGIKLDGPKRLKVDGPEIKKMAKMAQTGGLNTSKWTPLDGLMG